MFENMPKSLEIPLGKLFVYIFQHKKYKMNNCLLCLNITFTKNALSIDVKQECEATVREIMRLHFWFSNQILDSKKMDKDRIVCKTCWEKLENFHEFFCAVKFNHQISDETITETLDESLVKNLQDEEGQEVVTETSIECESVKIEPVNEDILYSDNTLEIETLTEIPRRSLRKRSESPVTTVTKKAKIEVADTSQKKRLVPMTVEETEFMKLNAEMKCEICRAEFTSWPEAMAHYRKQHRKDGFIRCCGRKIDKKIEMTDHIAWHHDPNIFTCNVCGKTLLTRDYLQVHEATHIPEEDRQFPCPNCTKKFGSAFSLANHKRLHKKDNLEKTIPCPKCPARKYKTETQLKLHWNFCHENAGEFMCELCSKVYKSKYNLENHLKEHAEPEKPLECLICGHFLKNKRRHAIHMSKHKQAEAKPQGYKCPHCDKVSKHRDALQSHIAYVHTNKRFKCEQCDREFKHEGNLKEHRAQHTGIDGYSCPFCDRTFKSSGNMHSHKKKMHPDEYAQLPLPAYLQPPSEKSSNDE